jgi:hypothetical protein
MSPYVSRPSEIEAVQWRGDNFEQVLAFGATLRGTMRDDSNDVSEIELFAGADGAQEFVPVPVGHWIVRSIGDYSDHWPVEDDYFRRKYELKEPQ